MSVVQLKWVSVPVLVVQPSQPLRHALHRLHVRWRWLGRNLRNQPPQPLPDLGERLLARV